MPTVTGTITTLLDADMEALLPLANGHQSNLVISSAVEGYTLLLGEGLYPGYMHTLLMEANASGGVALTPAEGVSIQNTEAIVLSSVGDLVTLKWSSRAHRWNVAMAVNTIAGTQSVGGETPRIIELE
jgi:hypothetical protein